MKANWLIKPSWGPPLWLSFIKKYPYLLYVGGTLISRTTPSLSLYFGYVTNRYSFPSFVFWGSLNKFSLKCRLAKMCLQQKHQKSFDSISDERSQYCYWYNNSFCFGKKCLEQWLRDSCCKKYQICYMISTSRCPIFIFIYMSISYLQYVPSHEKHNILRWNWFNV